ncbi:hypothetical protein HDU96_006860 [Phlyctochytrium bullatum]|nr:hypothetical protein HDU96_006860 [Phlyctochytrium bullatum]
MGNTASAPAGGPGSPDTAGAPPTAPPNPPEEIPMTPTGAAAAAAAAVQDPPIQDLEADRALAAALAAGETEPVAAAYFGEAASMYFGPHFIVNSTSLTSPTLAAEVARARRAEAEAAAPRGFLGVFGRRPSTADAAAPAADLETGQAVAPGITDEELFSSTAMRGNVFWPDLIGMGEGKLRGVAGVGVRPDITEKELNAIRALYKQPPPSEVRVTTTLQCLTNLKKNTLRLVPVASDGSLPSASTASLRTLHDRRPSDSHPTSPTTPSDAAASTPATTSPTANLLPPAAGPSTGPSALTIDVPRTPTAPRRFRLEFEFDASVPCVIRVHWVVRELLLELHNSTRRLVYVPKALAGSLGTTPTSLAAAAGKHPATTSEALAAAATHTRTFGPFPAGLHQRFAVPDEFLLDPAAFGADELTLPEQQRKGKQGKKKKRRGTRAAAAAASGEAGAAGPSGTASVSQDDAQGEAVPGSVESSTSSLAVPSAGPSSAVEDKPALAVEGKGKDVARVPSTADVGEVGAPPEIEIKVDASAAAATSPLSDDEGEDGDLGTSPGSVVPSGGGLAGLASAVTPALFWRAAAGGAGGEEEEGAGTGATGDVGAAATKKAKTPGAVFFPLVVQIEAVEDGKSGTGKTLEESGMSSVHCQSTYATLLPSKDGTTLDLKVLKQKVLIDSTLYTLQDIYGFTDPTGTGALEPQTATTPDDDAELHSMRECVVCMCEPKDTVVLPCRHLCLCRDCAEVLRFQGRRRGGGRNGPGNSGPPRCPICRQAFHSLLQINLPKPFKLERAASLAAGNAPPPVPVLPSPSLSAGSPSSATTAAAGSPAAAGGSGSGLRESPEGERGEIVA